MSRFTSDWILYCRMLPVQWTVLLLRYNVWRTTIATWSASQQTGRRSSRICLCPVKFLLHSINLVMLKLSSHTYRRYRRTRTHMDLQEHERQVCTINNCIEQIASSNFEQRCSIVSVWCWFWWTVGGGRHVPPCHLRLTRLRPAQLCLLSPPITTLSSSNLLRSRSRTQAPSASLQQYSPIWCGYLAENDPRRSVHVNNHHRTN